MVKKSGFSLIEISIAMVIGAVLSLMLYQMFQQTASVSAAIVGAIDDYSHILIFSHQIERDMMGIVLVGFEAQSSPGKSPIDSAKQKSSQKKIPFELDAPDGRLSRMRMITTHALPNFPYASSSLVQVVYRIVPQSNGLLQLMRSEMPYETQRENDDKPTQEFAVVQDVVSIVVEPYFREVREDGRMIVKRQSEWHKNDSERIPAPEFVTINIITKSSATGQEIPYTVLCSIPAAQVFVALQSKKSEKDRTPQGSGVRKDSQADTTPGVGG